jgi:hypothetical protein
MKVNNKIPWGLATGALALVTTLLARQQIEKKKLKPELALKLR